MIYAGLGLATIAAFERVRLNDFINYDDDKYITENPQVYGGVTLESVKWAFTATHASNWHPLTWLSHMLDCELFGVNAGRHHLVNLFFHIVNVLLLFWILRRMTGAVWASGFVAAAFALHPLGVESVAWVSERKDVLSGFFWMLTIAAYLHYTARPRVRRYLLVVLVFAAGLLAKPMLVTLPFVFVLLDYWPIGRFGRSVEGDNVAGRSVLGLVAEKIPLFVMSAASSVMTFIAQQRGGAVAELETWPVSFRLANALVSYVGYIFKMVYPSRLALLYPAGRPPHIDGWLVAGAAVLLTAVSIVAVLQVRRRPWLVVGWLWYVGTLIPVIGLVQVGSQVMADRYMYLPAIGIFIIVAWGSAEVVGSSYNRRAAAAISAAVVLAAMLFCSRAQVRHWRNNITLFGHAVEVTENNYVMHSNFGSALCKDGMVEQGLGHLISALKINPQDKNSLFNISRVFLGMGRPDKAVIFLNKLLELNVKTGMADVYYNLGAAYAMQRKYEKAIENFNHALRIRPGWADVYYNIGATYIQQHRYEQAIYNFKKALGIEPNHPGAIRGLELAVKRQ